MMGLNGIAVFFYGYNGVNNKICSGGGYDKKMVTDYRHVGFEG